LNTTAVTKAVCIYNLILLSSMGTKSRYQCLTST
jgi:hypothetical protein